MNDSKYARRCTLPRLFCALLLILSGTSFASAAGVTIVTHGFNSNVTDWIIPMTEAMPGYPGFPGTNHSCYRISITNNGGQFIAIPTLLNGAGPTVTNSGEIFVKLDWSAVDGLFQASATQVASATASAILASGFLPELSGRPIAELPLHLVGHSRGAPVATEIARLLGAQGVWVDQVTTLDPYPVSIFGDVSPISWANVLYADNFWQTLGQPSGTAITGAYNRRLVSLNNGYGSTHSNVHLWYHGTIDLTPETSDTQADIILVDRATWWTATEMAGAAAGFRYSRIAGGDRLSNVEPADAGNGRISDGFNRYWPLGGTGAANRTALSTNAGLWPNPILFALGNDDSIAAGTSFATTLHYQAGTSASGTVALSVFLDADFNPYNGNEFELNQPALAKTGPGAVASAALSSYVNAATVPPGTYAVHVRLTDGANTRHLTAAAPLVVTPSHQLPVLDSTSIVYDGDDIHVTVHGFPGQFVTMQVSDDLITWTPAATHTFAGTIWEFIDADVGEFTRRFYRVALGP